MNIPEKLHGFLPLFDPQTTRTFKDLDTMPKDLQELFVSLVKCYKDADVFMRILQESDTAGRLKELTQHIFMFGCETHDTRLLAFLIDRVFTLDIKTAHDFHLAWLMHCLTTDLSIDEVFHAPMACRKSLFDITGDDAIGGPDYHVLFRGISILSGMVPINKQLDYYMTLQRFLAPHSKNTGSVAVIHENVLCDKRYGKFR